MAFGNHHRSPGGQADDFWWSLAFVVVLAISVIAIVWALLTS